MNKNEMNPVKEALKSYLDDRAKTDEQFAQSYAKPNKNLDQCFEYIIGEVRKKGTAVYMTDAEVFGLAVHYYDEDEIKIEKVQEQVRTSRPSVELTEEEKAEAKEAAIAAYKNECQAKIKAEEEAEKKKAKKEALKKAEQDAPSLFSFDEF